MERLQRTSLAIESSMSHIEDSGAQGSDIEAYLTQHILIVLCSEVQQNIYSICGARAEKAGDYGVKAFANAAVCKLLRSVDKTELAGFVGHFGGHCKERFNGSLNESEFQKYSNAIKSRHDVAHKSGATISLRELTEIVPIAEKILDAVEKSIEAEEVQREES